MTKGNTLAMFLAIAVVTNLSAGGLASVDRPIRMIVDASYFKIVSITKRTNDVNITWTTVGGRSYVVQTNAPPPSGSYTNNFADLTLPVAVPGKTLGTTNYLHVGGVTNTPARYYRVRLVP